MNDLRSHLSHLFKRPRPVTQWPRRANLLIGGLIVVAICTLVWALLLKPAQLLPYRDADRWAAEAAVMGLGAFLLACGATGLAVVAYINSTEKPKLSITDASTIVAYTLYKAGTSIPLTNNVLIQLQRLGATEYFCDAGWQLNIVLQNTGPVAARFVAVRVTLTGAQIQRPGNAVPQVNDIPNWTTNVPHHDTFWWEGGADAIIHPYWQYAVPTLGHAYANLMVDDPNSGAEMLIEVIADDHLVHSKRVTMSFELPPVQNADIPPAP